LPLRQAVLYLASEIKLEFRLAGNAGPIVFVQWRLRWSEHNAKCVTGQFLFARSAEGGSGDKLRARGGDRKTLGTHDGSIKYAFPICTDKEDCQSHYKTQTAENSEVCDGIAA
jgi:hypothetical protein